MDASIRIRNSMTSFAREYEDPQKKADHNDETTLNDFCGSAAAKDESFYYGRISSKAEEKQQNRVLNRFVANYIEDFPPLTTTLRVSCYSYYGPASRMWPRFLWAAAKV